MMEKILNNIYSHKIVTANKEVLLTEKSQMGTRAKRTETNFMIYERNIKTLDSNPRLLAVVARYSPNFKQTCCTSRTDRS